MCTLSPYRKALIECCDPEPIRRAVAQALPQNRRWPPIGPGRQMTATIGDFTPKLSLDAQCQQPGRQRLHAAGGVSPGDRDRLSVIQVAECFLVRCGLDPIDEKRTKMRSACCSPKTRPCCCASAWTSSCPTSPPPNSPARFAKTSTFSPPENGSRAYYSRCSAHRHRRWTWTTLMSSPTLCVHTSCGALPTIAPGPGALCDGCVPRIAGRQPVRRRIRPGKQRPQPRPATKTNHYRQQLDRLVRGESPFLSGDPQDRSGGQQCGFVAVGGFDEQVGGAAQHHQGEPAVGSNSSAAIATRVGASPRRAGAHTSAEAAG
jgi:hypothetical protein